MLGHTMLFASKARGYLIIDDPGEWPFSLSIHVLFGKQITDLMLQAEAALWSLSDKLHTAKQRVF